MELGTVVYCYVTKTLDWFDLQSEIERNLWCIGGYKTLHRKYLSCSIYLHKIVSFILFLGTKWCGAGNIAENDDDFGTERDTDKCCRNHDYCPDVIDGYQTKYNLTNPNFFTRLHCNCDEEFRTCLKSVNTKTSKQVGQLYFTALGTQCYREEFPITGCLKYTYFPTKKCLEYTYDYGQRISYQWFDLPNF
ncbi:unnamed protein product [Psylliodes chrysocephalus]|uniref:Phospholipase A2 n=1 Tax=Psylliodes chrysocephalus TaxID=3402493 RepID=A0A9P0D1T5_9CUCU|nr:unnamed protein product [Psylliodes chrysocephala]